MKHVVLCGCILAMGAAASADVVQFLASDGNRLYRGDLSGNVQPFVTLTAEIQSLTRVPEGFSVAGANAGDIIATAVNATGGTYKVYRVDDAFGTPSLVEIGASSFGIGSLAFSPDGLFAVHTSQNPVSVRRIDTASFATLQTYTTGIAVGGSGGIAYNPVSNSFFITNATAHTLMNWAPGGNATAIGPVGFGFSNNGVEYLNNTLYGALRLDSPTTQMRVGTFDVTTGAFTGTTLITGILGNGTGFVTIPAPGAMALGLFGLVATRRRR